MSLCHVRNQRLCQAVLHTDFEGLRLLAQRFPEACREKTHKHATRPARQELRFWQLARRLSPEGFRARGCAWLRLLMKFSYTGFALGVAKRPHREAVASARPQL